jgi:hypothetical protein
MFAEEVKISRKKFSLSTATLKGQYSKKLEWELYLGLGRINYKINFFGYLLKNSLTRKSKNMILYWNFQRNFFFIHDRME